MDWVIWAQSLGSGWAGLMKTLSFLGTEPFYLLLIPAIYWCLEGALGLRVGVLLLTSAGLNTALKWLFAQPRPYWVSDAVEALGHEGGFGMPSGHAQNAVAIWGALAARLRHGLAWVAAALLALGIGFSRLYLGVHDAGDVLVGWAIGALLLALALRWEPIIGRWWGQAEMQHRLGVALGSGLALLALGGLARLITPPHPLPAEWAARHGAPLTPWDWASVVTPAGTLTGLVFGLARRGGPFPGEQGTWGRKTARFVLGLASLLLFYSLPAAVLPHDADLTGQVVRFARYALVGWWIADGAPWLFERLGLSEPSG